MITKITPVDELKQMFLEILLNKTDKISDIGNESVLNGIAYGAAKVGQKLLVNQSIVEAHIFPDTAYGKYLDEVAKQRGVSERFGATGSSTYIRLLADEGTVYFADTNLFTATNGVQFQLENDVTIGVNGFEYVKIKSLQVGAHTNVAPLTINRVNPAPTGHIACTNEYIAQGGRDDEDDELYRVRIMENVNQLSRTTMSYLEQVFMKLNNRVLRLHKGNIDEFGQFNLIVVPVDGADFTTDEFNQILLRSSEFLSLAELLSDNTENSLKLNNVDWLPVDVDFRVSIDPAADVDKVRRDIQIQMSKLFDYRFWNYGDRVLWQDLLFAARGVQGVRHVPDAWFVPRTDVNVAKYRLPRIRSFIMRDVDGNIIMDNKNILASFFYPNDPNESYMATVLNTI